MGWGEYHSSDRTTAHYIWDLKKRQRQTDWQRVGDLFAWLPSYLYIFISYQIRKALDVVNFFLKLKGSNYEILLCNNFFLKEFVYLGLF